MAGAWDANRFVTAFDGRLFWVEPPARLHKSRSYALAKSNNAPLPRDALRRAADVVAAYEGHSGPTTYRWHEQDDNAYSAFVLMHWSAVCRVAEAILDGRLHRASSNSLLDDLIAGNNDDDESIEVRHVAASMALSRHIRAGGVSHFVGSRDLIRVIGDASRLIPLLYMSSSPARDPFVSFDLDAYPPLSEMSTGDKGEYIFHALPLVSQCQCLACDRHAQRLLSDPHYRYHMEEQERWDSR